MCIEETRTLSSCASHSLATAKANGSLETLKICPAGVFSLRLSSVISNSLLELETVPTFL